ncbi:MAG: hypothetical protein GF331_22755 [Chitinivibrionales bacterium]|nr:hypothetical protein [Chitinivibrionales bacterium]
MRTGIALVLVLAAAAMALEKPRLGGFVENVTSVQGDDYGTISDIATLRLEGSWDYSTRGGVEAHLIVNAALQPLDIFSAFRDSSVMNRVVLELLEPYQSVDDSLLSTQSRTLDSASAMALQMIMQDVDTENLLRYLPYSSMYPRDKVRLDRALVKLYFKPFDLFIGRQMVGWGTGYGWNPTDVWNVKNPADPQAPKLGVNAIRAEIPFGAVSGLSIVVSPGPDIDHTSGGFRVKGNIGGFDLSLSGSRLMTADHALLGLPSQIIAGADMAGEVGQVGVWLEGAVINPVHLGGDYTNFDSLYAQIDAGLNYTFENGLYVMGEYYYNGLGQWQPDDYSAFDLLHLFAGDMAGFGQHYAMLGVTKDLFDDFMLELFALGNLSDNSYLMLPGLEYTFHDNIALKAGAQLSIGDREKSEYGALYHSGYLKVTGWF